MKNDPIADIQSSPDWRNMPVNRVGIRDLRHPMIFEDFTPSRGLSRQSTIARFEMLVDLPKNVKGTHMSRFVEILNEDDTVLSVASIPYWLETIVSRLNAKYGHLQVDFPYFVKKLAPVSKAASLMDYDVSIRGILENNQCYTFVSVVVPVTSLCPCSKEIADYGAHNQRSHVTVTVRATPTLSLMEIIQLVESKASSDLYGILKRTDEKAVTERAYDNPKFVEDMVRDVATSLAQIESVLGYKISSENFESIHNHSAFAEIDKLWQEEDSLKKAHLREAAVF
ncbi:MAG: GTP cyclohydrolase I FolE2 [Proteobacteria bacterium]|nr:GTP cyclohydrolase I FolE2 [Pseudomonadota bacterium]